MTVKDQILAVVLLGVVLLSIGACYKAYVMDRDYQVLTLTACDPEQQSCFALLCDEESENYNEDLCRQTESGEKRYFSFIRKKAQSIESCDARHEQCSELQCAKNEPGCEMITCDDQALAQYGDESIGCTPEVIMPVETVPKEENVEVVEPAPVVEIPEKESNIPSLDEDSAADAEQKLLDAQEEALLKTPDTTTETPVPVPVETTSPVTPLQESQPEPNHNLPI